MKSQHSKASKSSICCAISSSPYIRLIPACGGYSPVLGGTFPELPLWEEIQQRETHLRSLQLALLHNRRLRLQSPVDEAPQRSTDGPVVAPTSEEPTPATADWDDASDASDAPHGDDEAIDLFQLALQPF